MVRKYRAEAVYARTSATYRLYRVVQRHEGRLTGWAWALVAGIFLGLLEERDLEMVDTDFYRRATEDIGGVARSYLDPELVRSGLVDWEREAVATHFAPGASVAVLAAGSGREVLALLKMGYDAHGYEPHEALVAEGSLTLRLEGYPGRLHAVPRSSLYRVPPVQSVMVGWSGYMLIPSKARRVALLTEAAERLPQGGPILLSFFTRGGGNERRLLAIRAVAAALRRLRRREPAELGDALTPNFAHYFTRAEIARELDEGGFELVSFSDSPYGHAVGMRH